MKKENKEDQIKELETQVTCLHEIIKVEREDRQKPKEEIRNLQTQLSLAEALKTEYSIMWDSKSKELKETRELLRQTNDDRHKLVMKDLDNQTINKNLWVCLLINLMGNLLLIYLSFYFK